MPELTKRDVEILEALTERVRVFSLPQIARTWWPDSKNGVEYAGDRLKILSGENLIELNRAPGSAPRTFSSSGTGFLFTLRD